MAVRACTPEFKRDVVILIPKKAGADGCKNYMTLALQPVAAKVYAMVLRERLSKWLEQQLLEPQYGFRPGRGCADAFFSLRSLCSLAWNKKKTLYICMLDLAKAFDSADRDLAWRILLTRGAPPKLVALLKDLHTDHCGIIRAELDSADVHIDKGFKQGCVNAPGLFSIYLDTVVRQL